MDVFAMVKIIKKKRVISLRPEAKLCIGAQ